MEKRRGERWSARASLQQGTQTMPSHMRVDAMFVLLLFVRVCRFCWCCELLWLWSDAEQPQSREVRQ